MLPSSFLFFSVRTRPVRRQRREKKRSKSHVEAPAPSLPANSRRARRHHSQTSRRNFRVRDFDQFLLAGKTRLPRPSIPSSANMFNASGPAGHWMMGGPSPTFLRLSHVAQRLRHRLRPAKKSPATSSSHPSGRRKPGGIPAISGIKSPPAPSGEENDKPNRNDETPRDRETSDERKNEQEKCSNAKSLPTAQLKSAIFIGRRLTLEQAIANHVHSLVDAETSAASGDSHPPPDALAIRAKHRRHRPPPDNSSGKKVIAALSVREHSKPPFTGGAPESEPQNETNPAKPENSETLANSRLQLTSSKTKSDLFSSSRHRLAFRRTKRSQNISRQNRRRAGSRTKPSPLPPKHLWNFFSGSPT